MNAAMLHTRIDLLFKMMIGLFGLIAGGLMILLWQLEIHGEWDPWFFWSGSILTGLIGLCLVLLSIFRAQEERVRLRLERERERFEHDLVTAHAALMDRETRLRMSLEHALDGIITIDAHGVIEDVNPAAEQMFGYSRQQLIGRDVAEIIIPEPFRSAHRAALQRHARFSGDIQQIKRKVELPGLCADGSTIDLELGLSAISLGGTVHYTAILHDITQRKQLLETLKKALEVAESVHRMKSEFLANMSHEIRTPMNTIIGMTDLLLHTRLEPAEQRRDLEIIQHSADALLELINGILDLSKIDAGMIALERVTFDLSGQLESACETQAVRAHRKNLELYCWIDPDVPPTLIGDPLRLRQIVIHLISNAIKFTDEGEVVLRVQKVRPSMAVHEEVSDSEESATLRFSVTDTGIGIPQDKQAFIFERFTQLDGSSTRRQGGTGMGLAICQHLVHLMAGEIGLRSAVGQGSEFHFTARFGVTQRFVPGRSGQEADERRAVQEARTAPLTGVRILVVDANIAGHQIVAAILRAAGAQVTAAHDHATMRAQLGRERSHSQLFDVVVLDYGMLQTECINLVELDHYCATGGRVLTLVPTNLSDGDLAFLDWLRGAHSVRKPVWKFRLLKAVKMTLGQEVGSASSLSVPVTDANAQMSLEILLVEDQEESRKIAALILEQAGHSVTAVVNAEEAMERLRGQGRGNGVDMVLIDLQLAEIGGIELARRIRADKTGEGMNPQVPLIAVTAVPSHAEEMACQEAGMDGYLKKPYRACDLLATISKVIKRRQIFKGRPGSRGVSTVLKSVELEVAVFEEKSRFFLERAPGQLAQLRRAVSDRKAQDASRPVQWLSDAAREVGAWKVSIQGMRLRGALEQNRWEEAVESLQRLEGVCQEAVEALQAQMSVHLAAMN
ncbi:MAG: PAS domain S-box protein [Magnetococcales bacterium]|nr:PAS domain S-box protein [Magnetococcales bacterium]